MQDGLTTGDSKHSSTQRPTLPSWPSIRSFTWQGLETSSSRSLDRPTPQRHWICSCQPLETGHSTGPRWSDATARAGYAMTTTTTNIRVTIRTATFFANCWWCRNLKLDSTWRTEGRIQVQYNHWINVLQAILDGSCKVKKKRSLKCGATRH